MKGFYSFSDYKNMGNKKYSNSKEAMKILKISSCKLMHLRMGGKINYIKKGNSYLYSNESINSLKQ